MEGQFTLEVTVLSALDGEKGPELLRELQDGLRLRCEVQVGPETKQTRAAPVNKGQPFWNEKLTFCAQQASTISVKLLRTSPGESERTSLLASTSGITCAEVLATGKQELNLLLVAAESKGCFLVDLMLSIPSHQNESQSYGGAAPNRQTADSSLYPSDYQPYGHTGHVQQPLGVETISQFNPSGTCRPGSGELSPSYPPLSPTEPAGDQSPVPPWMNSPEAPARPWPVQQPQSEQPVHYQAPAV